MNILLIGSGGREHAMAFKLSQNPKVKKIYCAPGNGGTAMENKCENIKEKTIEDLLKFAKENKVYITIVGPEELLIKGIVDEFNKEGLKIFGPSKKSAHLEGSKDFSKRFMKKHGILTAEYESFTLAPKALDYLKDCKYPCVIKADGMAAGKGVVICNSFKEAEKVIYDFMIEDIFNGSGKKVVIEEFLEGVEASILSITDGDALIPFISAKDHKQIFDNNEGPNTGGMGVIAPNPFVTDTIMKEFNEGILKPTLRGLKEERIQFKGFLFFGLMITKKGVYLLEYNVRLGDPESQAILPLMKSDFYDAICSAYSVKLKSFKIKWEDKSSCALVIASLGYPGKYNTRFNITLDENIDGNVFISGGTLEGKDLNTSGGRVISLVTLGNDLEDSINRCYKEVNKISFKDMYYRKDIGLI